MNERANRPAMGIATETSHENKARFIATVSRQFFAMGEVEKAAVASLISTTSAKVNASHPINEARDGLMGISTAMSSRRSWLRSRA